MLEDIKDFLRTLRADLLSLFAQKVNQSTMTIVGEVTEGWAFTKESAGAANDEQASDQDGFPIEEAPEVGSFINSAAPAVDLKLQLPPGAAPQTGVELEGAREESA
eukprot:5321083-Pyramimonas_sp.AAC.1